MIYLITGGERSGKSSYAQNLALSINSNPVYVATARQWDGDFKKRIQRHQQSRDTRWSNMEEEKNLSSLPLDKRVVVIDCVTLWLTNYFVDFKQDIDACLKEAQHDFDLLRKKEGEFIFITNEIGMGVHATTESGRKFVELQGWMNQYIASAADHVVLMVSGIPLTVKGKV